MKVELQQKVVLYIILITVLPTIFIVYIEKNNLRSTIYNERKVALKNNVDIALGIVEKCNKQFKEGEISTEAEAKTIATLEIQGIKFGEKNLDYFWIQEKINNKPYMVMHPYLTELNGIYVGDYTDPDGIHIFKEFMMECYEDDEDPGEGFVEYKWQYYNDPNIVVPKLSFVKMSQDWNWIIGTGVYIDDVEEFIQDQLQTQIIIIIAIIGGVSLITIPFLIRDLRKKKRGGRIFSNIRNSVSKCH